MRKVKTLGELGEFLGELRAFHGYSYRGLSARTGLNPASLRSWELALHWPNMGNLFVLLRFYGESVQMGEEETE